MNDLPGKLIVVRHGESEWNALGKWTGRTDVSLTDKGIREDELLGEKMKDLHFDKVYVSEQVRTVETFEALMTNHPQKGITYEVSGAINERDYGDYTGKNKWDVKKEVGEKEFNSIRRGWDHPIPNGESLKMVYERVVPFLKGEVLPRLAKGENVLLVAHGNSIRALVKYIENVSDEDISKVEMIFGMILIYVLNKDGHMVDKEVREIETGESLA